MEKKPKTAAERKKKEIEKRKKDGTYDTLLTKQRERMRHKRKIEKEACKKLGEKELNELAAIRKAKERERKAKYRVSKKKTSTPDCLNSPSQSAYGTKASYGKAIARVKRNLPGSPRKKRAVIKHLAFEQLKVKPFFNKSKKVSSKALSKETKASVLSFYETDNISRQAPGKRDVVTTRDESGKHKIQKRHLTMGVMEAYSLYKEENPEIKIGKSAFANLRPPHVLLTSELPRNVCVCIHHENLILLLERLHKFDQRFPQYKTNLPLSWVCNEHNDDCWFNRCENCKDGKLFQSLYLPPQSPSENDDEDNEEPVINWYQWETVSNDRGKSRLEKIHKEGTIDMVYSKLVERLPSFTTHYFVKQQQSKHYTELKEQLPSNLSTGVLQIDFAENYTTQWQDEVQSAHWCKIQITLMTAVHWHGDNCKSAVVISDDTDHTKESIVVFLVHLIKSLVSSDIKVLHIWSDGPSSQFKNRYIAAILPDLESRFDLKIIWNFFATSHGKGPVDAIGGTVKRQVATRVIQRRAIVRNAESFYQCALECCRSINVYFKPATKIAEEVSDFLPLFNTAPALPGISTAHEFSIDKDRKCQMKSHAYVPVIPENSLTECIVENQNIQIGAFIIVNYDFVIKTSSKEESKTKRLIAIVKDIDGDKFQVVYGKALSKKRFKIIEDDVGLVIKEKIVSILPCPNLRRGIYEFAQNIDIDL